MDGFIFVSDLLFPLLLDIMHIDNLHDGSDPTGFAGFLEVVFLLEGLLLLLEFEEFPEFCFVENRGIDGGWLGDDPQSRLLILFVKRILVSLRMSVRQPWFTFH